METYAHPFVGNGRVTLAIRVKDGNMLIGASYCSPNDQFTRTKGRKIAQNRLNTLHQDLAERKGFFMAEKRNTDKKPSEQAFDMLSRLLVSKKVPRWAKAASVKAFVNSQLTEITAK